MTTRRDFLKTSDARSASGPPCRRSSAAPRSPRRAADKPGAKDTILVVVQLTGGNDGLNTVIPFKDADVLQAPADPRDPEGPGQEAQRRPRPAPVAGRPGEALHRRRRAVRRAGRRLPEPEPVALPLDGHLAGGQHRRDPDRRLARQGAQDEAGARVPPRRRQRVVAAGPDRRPGARAVDHVARRLPAEDRRGQRRRRRGAEGRHHGRGATRRAAATTCSTSSRAPR